MWSRTEKRVRVSTKRKVHKTTAQLPNPPFFSTLFFLTLLSFQSITSLSRLRISPRLSSFSFENRSRESCTVSPGEEGYQENEVKEKTVTSRTLGKYVARVRSTGTETNRPVSRIIVYYSRHLFLFPARKGCFLSLGNIPDPASRRKFADHRSSWL